MPDAARRARPLVHGRAAGDAAFYPSVTVDIEEYTDIIGRNFKQPAKGLGMNNSPTSHMWRTIIAPTKFLGPHGIAKPSETRDTGVMSTVATPPRPGPARRRQGRPVSGENDVGRERLLTAAEKLLRTMPPARVTISRIAQEAKADPALVRYYFGDRAALLVALVDRVTSHDMRDAQPRGEPADALADHIGKTVNFVRSAPFMHRLMIDELTQAGSEESRARVRTMNLDLVDFYRGVLRADGGGELVDADPLFLSLVVLGASDFFSSAQPLIRELVPAGTDMEALTSAFEKFLVTLILDGLRKR